MHLRLSPFWVGLLLIVILAAVPRLLTYRFSLPYVEPVDEPNYYLAGLEWRGLFDNLGYYDSAPPTYIGLSAGLQPVLEAAGIRDLAPTIQAMRLVSLIANLLALIFIALTARLSAGDLAGWVAAVAWGIAPLVLANGVLALPDPYVYLGAALAYYLAAKGLKQPDQARWPVASVIVGLVAVAFKYTALPLIGPGILVAMFVMVRRRNFRPLVIQIFLIVATGVWLAFIYGIDFSNLPPEGDVVQGSGVGRLWADVESSVLANMLNVNRLLNNIYYALFPINALVFVIIAAGGTAAFFLDGHRGLPQVHPGIIGLGLVLLLTIPWIYNSFTEVDLSQIRYVLPATAAACVIFGAAIAQIASVIPLRQPSSRTLVVVLAVAIMVWIPQIAPNRDIIEDRLLPDRRVALREWFDTNLEPGTVLVDQENHKTFNPYWGGIPYRHWVDWWVTDDVTEYPAAEWRGARGMSYAVIPRGAVEQMQGSTEGQEYLSHMLHLRDFFATQDTRGPEMTVYRLWRPEHETQIHFGDTIRLIGYDGSISNARPGDSLALRFYWQAVSTPPDNYSLFIHLTPFDEYVVLAQADGAPAVPERPTLTWDDPGETLISPAFSLSVPDDLAAGDYRVMIGLYNYVDGVRLAVTDEMGNPLGDTLEVTRLMVDE